MPVRLLLFAACVCECVRAGAILWMERQSTRALDEEKDDDHDEDIAEGKKREWMAALLGWLGALAQWMNGQQQVTEAGWMNESGLRA